MSTAETAGTGQGEPDGDPDGAGPPYIGALLRLAWLRVRQRMHDAIRAAGFTDLRETHFAVFSYPLPNGVRPADLARQMRVSRQAANYQIVQLEEMGYLERRPSGDGERRLIYLGERGWRVAAVIFDCLTAVRTEWAADIGAERFDVFLGVLRELAIPATRSGLPGHGRGEPGP